MISNLDIEKAVAVSWANTKRRQYRLPDVDEPPPEALAEARYWINLIDRVRYDMEQTLDGQIEERPF